jgi:hypothetical protein
MIQRTTILWCLLLHCFALPAMARDDQELVLSGAEYFLDIDPGEGRGNPLAALDGIFDEVEEEMSASLATLRLTPGPHLFCLRLRDSAGKWGLARGIAFDVLNPEAFSFTQRIAGAEYYLDAVVEGAGIPLQAADGAFDEVEEALIAPEVNTAELQPGEHTIYVRARDAQDRWGVSVWRRFHVLEPEARAAISISGAEHYFDRDPGAGLGQPMEARDGWFDESVEELTARSSTASLTPGWHTLYVRTRDSENRWGAPRGQLFLVTRQEMDLFTPAIVAAEYRIMSKLAVFSDWLPMSPAEGLFDSASEAAVVEFDTQPLPLGHYAVQVRMKDLTGRWGLIRSAPFSVVGNADFNGDGVVNLTDFFLFADAFGGAEVDPKFDLNGDGDVDFGDFFLFADAFGKAGGSVAKLLALAQEVLGLPTTPQLGPAYPNPFNPQTTIQYWLPAPGQVGLGIYDMLGQRVRVLVEQPSSPGVYRVEWDGRDDQGMDLASGIYLFRLQVGAFVAVRRMALLK